MEIQWRHGFIKLSLAHVAACIVKHGGCRKDSCPQKDWFLECSSAGRGQVVEYRDDVDAFAEGQCIICYGELKDTKVRILNCGHQLHHECAIRSLERHPGCPSCREVSAFPQKTCIICEIMEKTDLEHEPLVRTTCCSFTAHKTCILPPGWQKICAGCQSKDFEIIECVTAD